MFKKLEYSQITHPLEIVGVYICSNAHKQLPKINTHKFFTSLLSVRNHHKFRILYNYSEPQC